MAAPASLPESVAFDEPKAVSNAQGGTRKGWTRKHAAQASFRYLRTGEAVLQARLAGQQTLVVTIHNCAGSRAITPEWRMRDLRTGTDYNIRSIVPTDDRTWFELTCQSGVAV